MGVSATEFTKYFNNYAKSINNIRQAELDTLKMRVPVLQSIIDGINNENKEKGVDSIVGVINSYGAVKDLLPVNIIKHHPKEITLLNAKTVADKVERLSNMFKDFEILSPFGTGDYMTWRANITMKHVNAPKNFAFTYDFGLFKFYFRIKNHSSYDIIIKPESGNSTLQSGAYHPHIRVDGRACIGTYEKDIKEDIKSLNPFSIIQNITEIMEQYNPLSIYTEDIHSWIGQKCPVCCDFMPTGTDIVQCEKQKVMIHRACAVEHDGKFYNPLVIKKCSTCNESGPSWVFVSGNIFCGDCV